MLIICNGAFKSGSSWIHALVSSIIRVRSIDLTTVPSNYGAGKSPVSHIAEHRLGDFIKGEDILGNNYLTKAHFFNNATLQRSYPNEVVFIFIERDLRDAVVSHFHHFRAKARFDLPFDWYYWMVGRYKAYEIALFNQRCRRHFGSQNFFSYEQMRVDTGPAIQRLCTIIGLAPLVDSELRLVLEETSLDSMRSKAATGELLYYHDAGQRHTDMYRKGAVGEYVQHFDQAMLRDISAIAELELSALGRGLYRLFFTWRRIARHKAAAIFRNALVPMVIALHLEAYTTPFRLS